MVTQRTAKTGYYRRNPLTGEMDWIEGSYQPPKPETKPPPIETAPQPEQIGIQQFGGEFFRAVYPDGSTESFELLRRSDIERVYGKGGQLYEVSRPPQEVLLVEPRIQPPGSKLPPEAWKELNDPNISSEEWLAKWEAPVKVKRLEPSLRLAYPEMFDPTRSFGFTEEQLPGVVIEQLLLGMQEDLPGFVQDLTQRVGRYEAENILRQFGVRQDVILSSLDVPEQEQRTLNLIQSVVPEAESIESFSKMKETEWESFFETIRLGGMTSEKRQLLELIGLDPIQINEIAMRPRLVVDIDGIRKLTDIDLLTKSAFDLDGNYIGMYNPATKEFTKASPRNVLQKTWDWISFSSRQYWEMGQNAITGILPELIYPEVPEGYLGGLGEFMNETNRQQREEWRDYYLRRQNTYDDWLRKNPEIKPSVQYQEGAFKNPELLKDPMYYVYEFTSILPLVLATAAIGVGTGGVGVPFFALSTGLMGAVEGGAVYEDLLAAGAPEDKAAQMSLIAGGIIGALESAGRIPLLKQISPLVFGKFKKEAAKALVKEGLANTIKKFGRNFTITMFSETLTEVAQEIVGNAAVKVYDENRSIFENVPDIAVKTAVGMAGFGLFGAGVSVRMVKSSELRGLSDLARKAKGWVQDNKGNWYEAIKSERGEFVPGAEPGKPEGPSVESEIASWQQERKAREAEGADRMELATIDARIRDLKAKLEESKKAPEVKPTAPVTPGIIREPIQIEGGLVGEQTNLGGSFLSNMADNEYIVHTITSTAQRRLTIGDFRNALRQIEETAASKGASRVNIMARKTEGAIYRKAGYAFDSSRESWTKVLKQPIAPTAPAVEIPKAEAGMPEAGLQPSMLPEEVAAKEVFPKGKGKIVQISMEDQLKLEEARRATEEARPEVKPAYEMQEEIEGLKVWLQSEPAAGLTNLIKKTGWYKGEVKNLTLKQYKDLTGKSEIQPNILTPDKKHVKWEYALDDVATEMGYADSDTLKAEIERAGEAKEKLKELESKIRAQLTEKPLEPLPELTPEEVAENQAIIGQPKYNIKQINALVGFFADYINDPTTVRAWELTRELRRETRTQRAENLKARAKELIVSKGVTAEEGMKQAISETLAGELPTGTTEYFEGLTEDLRNALFAKVYHVLKNEPYEMASTVTALTNALTGRAIPREPGVKGGSAYTRLQRVFGDQPKVLKALDKMASEKKPLQDVVEGIYRETGGDPIPVDQETADYLRHLLTIPSGQVRLGEPPFILPSLPVDTRTSAQKQIDLQQFKLELTPDQYKGWSPERLEHLSFLRVNLLTPEYQAKLIEEKWIPPKPLAADTRTPAQRALDLQAFATELAPAPVGITGVSFEAPIEGAFKQPPLSGWPIAERKMLVKVLKEIAWLPVDIGNLLRALKATLDNSFLRQGKVLAAGHPLVGYKAHNVSWRAMFNQSTAEATWERIIRRPWFPIYEEIRLDTGHDPLRVPAFAHRKGTAQYRTAEEFGFPTVERWIPRITAKLPIIKPFERAFSAGTNEIVAGIMDIKYKETLRHAEKIATGEIKLKEGEGFDIVQEMTAHQDFLANLIQRGTLPQPTRGLAPVFNAFFFALRSKLGRFLMPTHLLGITRSAQGIRFNPRIMGEAWKDFLLFNAEISGIMFLGSWLGLWDLEDDPRNAEFMSARIGNTRIDPWAGYRQFAVLYARLVTKTGISSVTGAEYEVNPAGAVGNFIKYSLSPFASTMLEFWTGRNFLGQVIDYEDKKYWIEKIAAFSLWDIWEAFEGEGWGRATQVLIPAIYGEGVQTYTGDWDENWKKMGLRKFSEIDGVYYDAADWWADTAPQFKGVDPASLTPQKGFEPQVRALAEALVIKEHLETLPNEKLVSINADPAKGLTFADYRKQWQDRVKLVAAGDKAELVKKELQPDGKYKDVTYKGGDALKAFDQDERTRNANLGNFSQRQFALLNEYWSITDKKKRAEFLKQHEAEIGVKPRDEYLRTHPTENAQLAVWGQANLLNKEAYNQFKVMVKSLDIPDSAIPEMTLPPEESIDNYFKYQEMDNKNSWEAQLMMDKDNDLREFLGRQPVDTPIASLELKVKNRANFDKLDAFSDKDSPDYIADDKKRAEAIKKFRAGNPQFVDDTRRIEAIEKGTDEAPIDDALVNNHVEYGKLIDQEGIGSSSAEAMLYRVDNPDYDTFRTDTAIWDKQALTPIDRSRIPIWRIDVKYREQDAEYDALTTTEERQEYLEANPEYRMDRRRREAYSKFPTELVESYVAYYEYPDKGYRRERFLVENPGFAESLHKVTGIDLPDSSKVPSVEYDDIYDEWRDEFENPASVRWIEGTKTYSGVSIKNKVLTGFGLATIKREAYAKFIPNEYIDTYVQWRKIQSEGKPGDWESKTKQSRWFEDDWFMMENLEFYQNVYLADLNKDGKPDHEKLDFRKVPERKVFEKWIHYSQIQNNQAARDEYRLLNPDLDEWGVSAGIWSRTMSEKRRRLGQSPSERFWEDFYENQSELDERLKALK